MSRILPLVALSLIACGEEDLTVCEQAALEPATLEIGTGEDLYESLAEGDELQAVHGPQGGSHAWVALRATGIDPGSWEGFSKDTTGPDVSWVMMAGDVRIGEGYSTQRFLEHDGVYELEGGVVYLETWGLDDLIDWQDPVVDVTLVAELTDSCGTVLSTSKSLSLSL